MANRQVTVLQTDHIRIDWNKSATFNVYAFGVEADVFTAYGIACAADARQVAESWYFDNVSPTMGAW